VAKFIMKNLSGQTLISSFQTIHDPRVLGRVKYPLIEIIIITLCAIMSGAKKWNTIAIYAENNIDWFKQFLELEHGIPSEKTFSRVFALVCPQDFIKAFSLWAKTVCHSLNGKLVAIDGKTVRGSHNYQKDVKALHLINAYVNSEKLMIDCENTPSKSNEIKGIPILLKRLNLDGALVSIDAMGCQKGIANLIKLKKADYCLALKANHKGMYKKVVNLFSKADNLNYEAMVYKSKITTDIGHSRYETREYKILPLMYMPQFQKHWRGLQNFVEVTSMRYLNGKASISKRYYISSLQLKDSERIIKSIREHWGIENSLHYKLDVGFEEDKSRIFNPNAAMNFSTLRKLALAWLERTGDDGDSIETKLWKNLLNINNLESVVGF